MTVDGKELSLGQYDAIYIPRDSSVKITSSSTADIAEFSADVATRYPLQVVHFSQVQTDPGLEIHHRRIRIVAPASHAAGQEC